MSKDRCIMLGCNRVARRNSGGYCKRCADARRESLLREARIIVERGVCPDCGSRLHRNLALAGWWQCGRYGSPGFQREAGPACSFQTFTE